MNMRQENQKNNLSLIKKILYAILCVVQILLIVIVNIVSYLSDKKAGVNHHVYYMRYQYQNGIFSSQNLRIQSVLICLITVILIFRLIKYKNKFNKFTFIQNLIAVFIGLLLLVMINTTLFQGLLAYFYFIMAFEIVFVIQLLVILLI